MRRIISALLVGFFTSLALAQGASAIPPVPSAPIELADGAPDRYVVVPGDTLWGVAAKFLKDPYRWGQVWRMNAEEVKNPHRIYPGQVIALDRSGKEPRLRLLTVREPRQERIHALKQSIPSIPPKAIEPFLSEPRVLDEVDLEWTPRVVALQDDRVLAGTGDLLYTNSLQRMIEPVKSWHIFRPGRLLVDPDTRETLGREAYFLGSARLTREGDPTSFLIVNSREEVVRDDRLMPAPAQDVVSYIPHPPAHPVRAKVMSIYGGVNFSGPQSVVTLNRGRADGIETGHVLAADLAGPEVDNRYNGQLTTYKLPDMRNGLVFVFRVFERVSYALVMSAQRPVAVGDTVRTP